MTQFGSAQGLRLDAPSPGDIVTVRVKRRPTKPIPRGDFGLLVLGSESDEADNPQHYRMTNIWRVIATNGGQAVVEALQGYNKGRREMWPIGLHEWFEAGELWDAMNEAQGGKDD